MKASDKSSLFAWFRHGKRAEYAVYLIVIIVIYLAPVVSAVGKDVADPLFDFEWSDIVSSWGVTTVFVVAVALHDLLLAPILIERHRPWTYIAGLVCLAAMFQLYQCTHRPKDMPSPGMEKAMRDYAKAHPSETIILHEKNIRHRPATNNRPPLDMHDIIAFVLLIMAAGANLGIKGYFKSARARKRMEELESDNLKHQLQYLKYQINPHFLMNTLNNIHALVDIEPEKAKASIVILSKLMRHSIYQGEKQLIPVTGEVEFIKHFIELMMLRYTSSVTVNTVYPASVPNRVMPPLLLVVFIENAFKHGVSYKEHSCIDVSLDVDKSGMLTFCCTNSKFDVKTERGGLGLENVKKRLDLTYGNNYSLNIKDTDSKYSVTLKIPTEAANH